MKNLTEFAKEIHEANKKKGFDVSKENVGQSLMLVVSELGEAIEAHRKGKFANGNNLETSTWKEWFENHYKDTFEDEIADAIIRLLDLSGGLGIDIEKHIEMKLNYNSMREFKHGKKY